MTSFKEVILILESKLLKALAHLSYTYKKICVLPAEKIGLIEDVGGWLAIRELRNLIAHEYMEEQMTDHFRLLKKNTLKLLEISTLLEKSE